MNKTSGKWKTLPKGWTDESVKKFWETMTGDVKHKVTKCMKEMEGKVDDTGAFCGSLADKVEGTTMWRGKKAARLRPEAFYFTVPMPSLSPYGDEMDRFVKDVQRFLGTSYKVSWRTGLGDQVVIVVALKNRTEEGLIAFADQMHGYMGFLAKQDRNIYKYMPMIQQINRDMVAAIKDLQAQGRVARRVAVRWAQRVAGRDVQALNKFNPTELIGALLTALNKQGLRDVADRIRKLGIPKMINDAWMDKKGLSGLTSEQQQVWYGRTAATLTDFQGNGDALATKIAKELRAFAKQKAYGKPDPKVMGTGFIYSLFNNGFYDRALGKKLWDLFEGSRISLDYKAEEVARRYYRVFMQGDDDQNKLFAAAFSVILLRKLRMPRLATWTESLFNKELASELASASPAGAAPAGAAAVQTPSDIYEEGVAEYQSSAQRILRQLGDPSKAQTFASGLAEDVNWSEAWRVIGEGADLDENDPSVGTMGKELEWGLESTAAFITALLRLAGMKGLALKVKRLAIKSFSDSYMAV